MPVKGVTILLTHTFAGRFVHINSYQVSFDHTILEENAKQYGKAQIREVKYLIRIVPLRSEKIKRLVSLQDSRLYVQFPLFDSAH